MGTTGPALLPLFRSATQLQLLGAIFASPAPLSVSELAERIGAPISTVSRETTRLAEAGLVKVLGRGRSKFVEARRDFSWAPALAEMLDRTVGIAAVVSADFGQLDGVEQVAVFGSWAERRLGRHGPPPNDIDVLVVGEPVGLDVVEAAGRASARLGLDISPVVVASGQWRNPRNDPVLRSIRRGPLVVLVDRRAERG